MAHYEEWVSKIVADKLADNRRETRGRIIEAVGNHRKDQTRPWLEYFADEGYDTVTWDSAHSTHSPCRELNRQKWTMKDFLSGLQHDAPMFERSHPGDTGCKLIVTGPNLDAIILDSFGNWDVDKSLGQAMAPQVAPKKAPKKTKPVVDRKKAPDLIYDETPFDEAESVENTFFK